MKETLYDGFTSGKSWYLVVDHKVSGAFSYSEIFDNVDVLPVGTNGFIQLGCNSIEFLIKLIDGDKFVVIQHSGHVYSYSDKDSFNGAVTLLMNETRYRSTHINIMGSSSGFTMFKNPFTDKVVATLENQGDGRLVLTLDTDSTSLENVINITENPMHVITSGGDLMYLSGNIYVSSDGDNIFSISNQGINSELSFNGVYQGSGSKFVFDKSFVPTLVEFDDEPPF